MDTLYLTFLITPAKVFQLAVQAKQAKSKTKKKEDLEDHLIHVAQTILRRLYNHEFSRRAVKYASEPKWNQQELNHIGMIRLGIEEVRIVAHFCTCLYYLSGVCMESKRNRLKYHVTHLLDHLIASRAVDTLMPIVPHAHRVCRCT